MNRARRRRRARQIEQHRHAVRVRALAALAGEKPTLIPIGSIRQRLHQPFFDALIAGSGLRDAVKERP